MSPRFVWQIFRKDAQRLRWMIALTLVLLARLTHLDVWRSGATPGSEEGWLNILLPLAWSFLIALAIQEDPAVSDSPFWVTVPCRWPSVLAAKTAFVAAFVHLPYFLACAMIVHARGFAPFDYLPDLFHKQVVLLAVTAPAIAVATLVANVTQFMIVAIILATVVGAPSFPVFLSDGPATRHLREILVFSATTIAALGIAAIQYARFRVSLARVIFVAAILISAVIWWLPRERFDSLQAAVSPASAAISPAEIRLARPAESHTQLRGYGMIGASDSIRVAIPLTVPALPAGYSARYRQSEVRLREPDGETRKGQTMYEAFRWASFGGPGPLVADFHQYPGAIPDWQLMAVGKSLFDRIEDSPVTIEATALATYYRTPDPNWTSVGENLTVAGVGHCSTGMVGDNPNDEELRVTCESSQKLPTVHVRLLDPPTNRDWKQDLGPAPVIYDYPVGTWLSPVDRSETFFPLTDEAHYKPLVRIWQAPREILPTARIAIVPEIPAGNSIVRYELPGIKLSQYRITQ